VQSSSILADSDYLAALEHAPNGYSRDIYKREAARIAEIQRGILAVATNEEPYDVFICYKESTDGGSRTKDSSLAQDIYYQLTKEGYKVFFSRITLESKLGQEYEPYIFSALNSAKVMLVVGTKPEHFTAVWVRNEWSRYLALMKTDRSRLLIPCYQAMDAYDLPEELSMLQSQDMSKIGFVQDLLHGIEKVLKAKTEQPTLVAPLTSSESPATPLVKRAFLMLEDSEWAKADDLLEQALNADPENSQAYIGKLMIDLKITLEEELGNAQQSLVGNKNYNTALRFSNATQLVTYNNYEQAIQNRLENERVEVERKAEQEQIAATKLAEQSRAVLLAKRASAERIAENVNLGQTRADKGLCPFCGEKLKIFTKQCKSCGRKRREHMSSQNTVLPYPVLGFSFHFGKFDWLTLCVQESRVLLVSKEIIEKRAFDANTLVADWEYCTLREYLNGEFLNTFSNSEKALIAYTRVKGTTGGNVIYDGITNDKIFLLSIEQANKYFNDKKGRTLIDWWWLRDTSIRFISSSQICQYAAAVLSDGSVDEDGYSINIIYGGVRPALWLDLGE
jgi:hypothetical protein